MSEAPRPIYLDYHATTPVDPRVVSAIVHHMSTAYGNASSADHAYGDEAALAIEGAEGEVRRLVRAFDATVVFTSGATEGINLVLQGMATARGKAGRLRIAAPATEHAAVLDTCRALGRAGQSDVLWLAVDTCGRVDLAEVEAACKDGVHLLCVMAANNEVGTIAPVAELGAIARRHGVPFLCDATQACGRVPLAMDASGVTFLVLSAHKMHGPKGVGAVVTSAPRLLKPLLHGGEQQRGLRAGTLNVPGIVGLSEASRLRREEMGEDEPVIAARRDRLEALLRDEIPGMVVNGDIDARLAGNLHVSFPGIPNGAIIARVRRRLAVATGAACSSGIEASSHVLQAMRLSHEVMEGAIRIGVGKWTTDDEVTEAAELLAGAVQQIEIAIR